MLRKIFLPLFALAILLRFSVWLFLNPPFAFSDDLSLYNPVYMLLHYGKMVYPAYGYFDTMTVHPPLHYYIVAGLMKGGVSIVYAERMPVFAGFLLCMFLILRSTLRIEIKIAGLFALFIASHNQVWSIRPDISLSYLWLAGLIALQTSANENWRADKLLLGSICLSLASCMQYFASFAFAGVFLFAGVVYALQTRSEAKKKSAYLLLPVFIIVGAYLLLQVFPNLREIAQQILLRQNANQESSLVQHYEQYKYWYPNYPVLTGLLIIPACIWTLLIFGVNRQMRLAAFASVPLTFFVWLFSKGKSGGYFLPEMFLFWWGFGYLILRGLMLTAKYLLCKLEKKQLTRILVVLGTMATLYTTKKIFFEPHDWNFNIPPLTIDCEQNTARACCKKIHGPDARIGGRMDLWYVSGASDWYFVSPDITFQNNSPYNSDLYKYFSRFDAIADHAHMSNNSSRNDQNTLLSWYVDDTFKLKGFYLTNDFREFFYPAIDLTILPQLFYTADKPKSITGFFVRNNNEITSFESNDSIYDHYFMSLVTSYPPHNLDSLDKISLRCSLMALPDKSGIKFQFYSDAKECVLWGVFKKELFEKNFDYINTLGKIKEVYRLKSRKEDKSKLLQSIEHEPPVKFYKDYESFINRQSYYHD